MTNLRASQARVLNMFVLYGDMNDKQLITYLHDAEKAAGLKLMSDSGVRTRRSELSKPNMDRLAEIVREQTGVAVHQHDLLSADQGDATVTDAARRQLRIEGFRSKLWDTGKREIVDGRTVVVWGLAR
ncbi:MAG TPA: hypothetical protein VL333_13170 [Candidatus Saccharimonadales bacterium]|nr:hypothetical protein [Candidatus Saccharimonadales bacterium]